MKAGTDFRLAHYLRATPFRGTSVARKKRGGYYQVLIARYFFFVGSLLLAMLFGAGWYLPDSPQSFVREAQVDKSIIRIKSAHKWPEQVVIDTSLPLHLSTGLVRRLPKRMPARKRPRELLRPRPRNLKPPKRPPAPEWPLIEIPRRPRCRRSHLGRSHLGRSCRPAGNEGFSAAGKFPNCAGTAA